MSSIDDVRDLTQFRTNRVLSTLIQCLFFYFPQVLRLQRRLRSNKRLNNVIEERAHLKMQSIVC